MRFILPFFLLSLFINLSAQDQAINNKGDGFTDSRDGRFYKTVKIGSQVWMAENLAYNAGDGAWAYDNNEENALIYGYLYDWETAKNACPDGWHLPGEEEWNALTDKLGGREVAGAKLREVGSVHWKNRSAGKFNIGATNESGFTALPGGYFGESEFKEMGVDALFWSAGDIYGRYAWFREVGETETGVGMDYFLKQYRLSVRCIKD